ncbi:MAG: toxic anion resistance protein, partial [Novosphingobium sp.]
MSTETQTATATEFTLTPPDPVPAVAPEQAAGLVPVTTEQKSKLDTKVDAFVNELVSVDANSPQFGEKVDQITRMGQEQIRA